MGATARQPAEPDLFALRVMTPRGRVAIVVHLHDAELWEELSLALVGMPEPFDLIVTLAEEVSEQVSSLVHGGFPWAQVVTFPDYGRDVFPFVALINSGVLFRYQVVCKLDVKRSSSRMGHEPQRELLGNPEHVENILAAFDADPDLGIVVADLGEQTGPHIGFARLDELCSRVGMCCPEHYEPCSSQSYWVRPFLLHTIAGLKLMANDFEGELLPGGGVTALAVEHLLGIICKDAAMQIAEASTVEAASAGDRPHRSAKPQVQLIAFYLPQFHPIPENDAWWGKGFTEWTNVTRTKPQFRGHRQPRLPADLGFYDLRLPEVRRAQADLARQYGVTAFCYYYYWFDGQTLLNRPLEEVLATGDPNFPFLLLWANEPWSRGWDGRARDILMPQDYKPGWVRRLARDVAPVLRDQRYLRFQGSPVFLLYRVRQIPNRTRGFPRVSPRVGGVGGS